MITQLSQKVAPIFECKKCDYKSCRQSDFNKHLSTPKHHNSYNSYTKLSKLSKPNKCECGKEYKYRQGLYFHKKTCQFKNTIETLDYDAEDEDCEVKMLTNLVLEVVKQNKELTTQNNELANKIVDLCQQIKPITTITNNTNINNKTFNLNVFLNETCKDAMNIMDFVDSIKLQLSDLESVGKLGFIEGISNIIIKNLKAMDVDKRPVHCSDSKREVMYIKHDNKWEKENENKLQLRKAIKQIAHKNTRLLPKYKENNPECDTTYSEQYNKLIIEAMGGLGSNTKEKEDKIIHKIAKEVTIDKFNI
jgi:hypothetical protein